MRGFLMFLVGGLLLPVALGAQQEQTLFSGPMEHGGFGGPVVKFTQIGDQFGVFVGGRGGWIINHSVVLGGGGYGLANPGDFTLTQNGTERRLGLGYGGVELEYIHRWADVAHLTLGILVGAGGASWYDWRYQDWGYDDYTDAFFIAEPAASLEVNLLHFFRLGFGGSYRFVEDVDLLGLSEADLKGPSGTLTFKFGSF
jgi:hypothetical protein